MPLVSDTAAAFESASVCSCCLISEAANLGTEGVFTLSAPNTLVLYSFVLGKQGKKKGQKKKRKKKRSPRSAGIYAKTHMISDVSLRICIRYHRRRGCRGLSARRKVGSAAVHPPAPGSASSGAAKRISHAPPPRTPLHSCSERGLRRWPRGIAIALGQSRAALPASPELWDAPGARWASGRSVGALRGVLRVSKRCRSAASRESYPPFKTVVKLSCLCLAIGEA